ncbi:transient receptor potential cation channel subfamily M member 8-like [Argopecten irradians]|uniref:transient receptor potential cation channel subfamily M member 8-like n=1 Tax=Argopecten irradians TaxID=31199 RepID=UPI003717B501
MNDMLSVQWKHNQDMSRIQDRDDELGFVSTHFHEFYCENFDEEDGQEEMLANTKLCKCGHTYVEHQTNYRPGLFRNSLCCGRRPINQYSSLKYVQVSTRDDLGKVFQHFSKYWKIKEAGLVISVVGDEIPKYLWRNFQSKLVQFSRDADAMVMTSGLDEGISTSVDKVFSKMDQSYKQRKVPVIGLSPWNMVKHKHRLMADPRTFTGSSYKRRNVAEEIPIRGDTRLSQGVGYHLFVDFPHDKSARYYTDTCVGAYKEEVMQYRHKIEQKLMQLNENEHTEDHQQLSAPVVIVLAGGNESTLTYIDLALKANLPVLVIKGTDGLARFISNANNPSLDLEDLQDEFFHDISLSGRTFTGTEKTRISNQLQELSENLRHDSRNCFAVCDLDKEVDFNNKILTVLLRSSKGHPKRLSRIMSLAVEWNMLKNEQIQELLTQHLDSCDTDLFHETLLTAITTQENRLDWIEELIGKETTIVDFNNFISRNLHLLYERACYDYGMTVWEDIAPNYLHSDEKKSNDGRKFDEVKAISKREVIVRVLVDLFDRYDDDYITTDEELKRKREENGDNNRTLLPDRHGNYSYPYKHLLIWAVVFLRSDIAKIAWKKLRHEPLQSAIAMCFLSEEMKSKIDDRFQDEKNQLGKIKTMFEDLSIQLLSACNVGDENLTQLLLCSPSSMWGGLSALQMAASGKVTNFMAAQAVQKFMDDIWNGGIFVDVKRMVLLQVMPLLVATPVMKVRVPYILERTNNLDETYGRRGGSTKLFMRTLQKFNLYFNSPRTKFFYHNMTYFIFLGLFVYMVLVDFRKYSVTMIESFCLGWILTLQIDELYTLGIFPTAGWRATVRDILGVTNVVETLNALLFVAGYVVHYVEPETTFTKIAYSINLVIFQLKIFRAYIVDQTLGPQVVMVKEMTASMLQFLLILLIFIVAYGTSSQALLYTERHPSWEILRDIFYQPYWTVYGEVGLDELTDDPDCDDDARFCRKQHGLVYIFLGIYILLSNVLLLNLLIAIFSNIYNVIFEKTSAIWRYNMYFLTYEYQLKTVFVPPFSILIHFLRFLRYILCCRCRKQNLGNQITLTDNEYHRVNRMQIEERKNMFQKEEKETQTSLTKQIQKIVSRLDKIEETLSGDHMDMTNTVKLDRHNSKRSLRGPSHAVMFTTIKRQGSTEQFQKSTLENLQRKLEDNETHHGTENDHKVINSRKQKRLERKSMRKRDTESDNEHDGETKTALEKHSTWPNVIEVNKAASTDKHQDRQKEENTQRETESNREVFLKKNNKIEPENINTNQLGEKHKRKGKASNSELTALKDEILGTFEYKKTTGRKKEKKTKQNDIADNAEILTKDIGATSLEGHERQENQKRRSRKKSDRRKDGSCNDIENITSNVAQDFIENDFDVKVTRLPQPDTRAREFRRTSVRRSRKVNGDESEAELRNLEKDSTRVLHGISPYLSSSDNESKA